MVGESRCDLEQGAPNWNAHRDVEASEPDWRTVQPAIPRRGLYFCCPPYIFCLLPVAFLAYVLGGIGMLALSLIAIALYTCCGLPVCSAYLWTRSWVCYPWQWASDLYPKVLYLGYQSILLARHAPTAGPEGMPISGIRPKEQLAKAYIDYALNIKVPMEFEDEFTGNPISVNHTQQVFEENLSKLPMTDNFDAFKEGEDPVKFVMKQVGSIYPIVYQTWDEKQSNEALARFCLYGLAAHRIEIETEGDTRFYVVRTNALSSLPVRQGYARYGGDAFFDMNWNPVKIVDAGYGPFREDGVQDLVVTRPNDERWNEAKFRFRSSVSVLVTLADHLYGIHLQTANIFVTALREQLSADHPVRRFLTPYSYQTISVNHNARTQLIAPRSMSNRCFAFTDQGLQMAYAAAPKLLRSGLEVSAEDGGPIINREHYIDYLKSQGIDTPYLQQSLKYWRITRKFVVDYLACYYQSHEHVVRDQELYSMLRQFSFQLQFITPDEMLLDAEMPGASFSCIGSTVTKRPGKLEDVEGAAVEAAKIESLYDRIVDVIANYMFLVTAGHEQVGAVEAYVQDVSFCAFKWVPGQLLGTKQTATAQALLMSFTSTPMPKLLGSNWSHLFPAVMWPVAEEGPTPASVFETYQKELQDFSDECQAYNDNAANREFPYCYPLYTLDPKNLETSVSV